VSTAPKAPKATKSRSTRSDAQRQAILDAASLQFIEKGFGGTNINDIADAVGMTRTALYYYFPSKESMLEVLTREVTERASDLAKEVAQHEDRSPQESLRQLIYQHAALILAHPLQFRVAERSESSLPEALRQAAQVARRALRDDFVNIIRRGIAQGAFLDVDADVAAFSIIGMCNWSAWWFDSRRGTPIEPIAELIAAMGLRMLQAEDKRRGPARRAKAASAEVGEALARMREAMDTLERQLGAKA